MKTEGGLQLISIILTYAILLFKFRGSSGQPQAVVLSIFNASAAPLNGTL